MAVVGVDDVLGGARRGQAVADAADVEAQDGVAARGPAPGQADVEAARPHVVDRARVEQQEPTRARGGRRLGGAEDTEEATSRAEPLGALDDAGQARARRAAGRRRAGRRPLPGGGRPARRATRRSRAASRWAPWRSRRPAPCRRSRGGGAARRSTPSAARRRGQVVVAGQVVAPFEEQHRGRRAACSRARPGRRTVRGRPCVCAVSGNPSAPCTPSSSVTPGAAARRPCRICRERSSRTCASCPRRRARSRRGRRRRRARRRRPRRDQRAQAHAQQHDRVERPRAPVAARRRRGRRSATQAARRPGSRSSPAESPVPS